MNKVKEEGGPIMNDALGKMSSSPCRYIWKLSIKLSNSLLSDSAPYKNIRVFHQHNIPSFYTKVETGASTIFPNRLITYNWTWIGRHFARNHGKSNNPLALWRHSPSPNTKHVRKQQASEILFSFAIQWQSIFLSMHIHKQTNLESAK